MVHYAFVVGESNFFIVPLGTFSYNEVLSRLKNEISALIAARAES